MNPSVFVGIPSGTEWKADFGLCLASMIGSIGRPLPGGRRIERVQLWNTKGSILSRSRTTLVKQAIETKCSHILFIDTDMTFPTSTLHRLLHWQKPIVAANCVTKGIPANPTARLKSEVPAGKCITSEGKRGLERVWRVGTGVMLIETRVFDKLPQPWFPIVWNPLTQDYTGEDWSFCELAEAHGFDIFVDHDLSPLVGHIGSITYGHEHIDKEPSC